MLDAEPPLIMPRSAPRHPLRFTLLVLAALGSAGPAAAQLPADQIRRSVDERRHGAVERFRELLSHPNDAHHTDDILRLVEWWEARFEQRGFRSERLTTPRAPLLLAERSHPGARRTALIYLQADGQPVDPTAWNQPDPYTAVLKQRGADGWTIIPWERLSGEWNADWRIFARSASDSKGPNAQFLEAVDLLERLGVTPDVNLKVIVDFEEERGSPHLAGAVERHRERLAADMLVILDGPPHISNRPTLKFGARGIASATLTTYGPRVPLHSGHYGNYAPNPALHLAEILASTKDRAGRVVIPGWYDGVTLSDSVRAILAAVPDDEDAIMRELGIATRDSVGLSLQEAVQYPSLNIRGMQSAWVGDQTRTIVPATATAELDIRLVKESDPERLLGLLRRHIEGLGYLVVDREPTEEERLRHPRIVRMDPRVSYGAFRTEFDSDVGRWLTGALLRLYGEPPIRVRTSGGSIPISPFVEILGIPAVSVPTVNADNNQHSPNENIRLGDFLEGIAIVAAVLAEPWIE